MNDQDIDWQGSSNLVRAAINVGVDHILLVSSMGTTQPDTFLDMLGNGHALFYKLNGEADLMASGAPYTIVKPGGLLDGPGGLPTTVSWQSCRVHSMSGIRRGAWIHFAECLEGVVSTAGENLLLSGHDDNLSQPRVNRADLADVLAHAILMPEDSKWLRFDLSRDSSSPATGDFKVLFDNARDWNGDTASADLLVAQIASE